MESFRDLYIPENLKLADIENNTMITHQQQLKLMDPYKFEEMTEVWCSEKIGSKYTDVKRFSGSGDKGRDIVGYFNTTGNIKIDIYQCKHYDNKISLSDIKKEFYKLCYFTYNNTYPIPENYYIVSPQGCSTDLRTNYIDKPQQINTLINEEIKNGTALVGKINLKKVKGLIDYVNKFDFSIVHELQPNQLIKEFSCSKFFIYYFFTIYPKLKIDELPVPEDITLSEKLYIDRLLEIYSELDGIIHSDIASLKRSYVSHLDQQRSYFYSTESLRRAVRDSLPSMDYFNQAEDIIHKGISDILSNFSYNGFNKLEKSLERSVLLNLDACQLKNVLRPNEKMGVCHNLANENKVRWVEND
ncbi:ABC-three component system protein [Clostridium intestinale]|uniref:Restriction endonuclease n=1 Tax=Clostridium intestinale DSM 6191 TaxID=1121320 RepID=A0A1M5TD48_9CLOT|nr:ABC-three component system protein [Clostridium intestinale]SHH48745.1 Restriction endonuclease [Clostridium intestinale DSM 6191]